MDNTSNRKQPGKSMMVAEHIPFNRASFQGKELAYIADSVRSGHISGDGPYTKKCHQFIEERLGVRKALLTTSCTDALEMSAVLCGIGPGDEVIVPSFAFVSTANAFVLHGAKPVFADIRPDTLNLDESQVEGLITKNTKAIVALHYAGVGCEMDTLLDIAQRHGLSLIEDNAHGFLGRYKGRYLGSIGRLATQSYHETKNVTCGEGGALLINDATLIERAEIIREKGTNRSCFFRGQVSQYTWLDVGASYLPSDMLAAFLYAQLEAIDNIQKHRRQIWETYQEQLEDWAAARSTGLPIIPEHCEHPYHMFYLKMPSCTARDALIRQLRKKHITSVFHYLPLHLSDMGRRLGGRAGQCPVSEDVSERLVRLPFFNTLSEHDQRRVVEEVLRFEP